MAHQVRSRPGDAILGERRSTSKTDDDRSYVNAYPQAKRSDTLQITGATNAKTYSVLINLIVVSYTASGAAVVAEIADGLAAAIGAEGSVNASVTATSDGIDTITIVSNNFGIDYSISESDAQITLASVTANATADEVGFGVAVFVTGEDDIAGIMATLAKSASFTAQIDTITPTHVASGEYHFAVIYDGLTYTGASDAGVDQAATSAALIAALEDVLDALPVTVSASGADCLITADTAGDSFDVSVWGVDGGGGLPAPALASTRSLSTSLADAFGGAAERSYAVEGSVYPANFGFSARLHGEIWVADADGVSKGDRVFVDGADGTFRNAAAAGRIPLPAAKARFGGASRDSGDALAWLDLSF